MSKRALIAAVSLVIGTLSVAAPALAKPSGPATASPSMTPTPTASAGLSGSASSTPSSTTPLTPVSSSTAPATSAPTTTPPKPATPPAKPSTPTLVKPTATGAGSFTAVTPTRLLDTRTGLGAPTGAIPAYGTVSLQVAGTAGVPSSGVSAALVNITVLSATQPGYLTAWPDGTTRSSLNNLFIYPGHSVSNLTVGRLGSNGKIDLVNRTAGPIQVTVDVSGYYRAGTATAPGSFTPLDPVRFLDTRTGTGVAKGSVPANAAVKLQLAGRGSVPASGVSAVALNLFALSPTQAGGLTVYPDGSARPPSYSPYFAAGRHVGELVIARLSAAGKVDIFNGSAAPLAMAADVVGYYRSGAVTAAGGYQPIAPTRVLDTRSGLGTYRTALAPGGTAQVKLTGTGGVPASGVSAVFVNQYAFTPAGAGALSDFAGNTPQTHVSSGDLTPGVTSSTPSLVQVGSDGTVLVHSTSNRPVQVLVEVMGYLLGTPPSATVGQVEAQVTDRHGKPLQNVQVSLQGYTDSSTVYSDATGHALFAGVTSSYGYSVYAYPSALGVLRTSGGGNDTYGYIGASTTISNQTPMGSTLEVNPIALADAGAVTGRVTNAAGQPLANVSIESSILGQTPDPTGVVTDANGRYTLPGMWTQPTLICFTGPAGGVGYQHQCYDHQNRAYGQPYSFPGTTITPVADKLTSGIDASLDLGAAVSGRIVDGAGQAAPGMVVDLYPSGSYTFYTTETKADGSYSFTSVTPGSYSVCVFPYLSVHAPDADRGYVNQCYHRGFPLDHGNLDLAGGTATGDLDMQLDHGGSVTVTATDRAGHPISGVAVTVDRYSATTDASGQATVSSLNVGQLNTCYAASQAVGGDSAAGYLSGCVDGGVTVTTGHTTQVHIALASAAGLQAHVTDPQGRPIGGILVDLRNTSTSVEANAYTNVQGNVIVGHLTAGTYTVCLLAWGTDGNGAGVTGPAGAAGYANSKCDSTITVADGQIAAFTGTLQPLAGVAGTVTDSDGHPLHGVLVGVTMPADQTGSGTHSLTTDAQGHFQIGRIEPGDYTVCYITKPWYQSTPIDVGGDSTTGYVDHCFGSDSLTNPPTAPLSAGSVGTADAVLASAASITGRVVDAAGNPVSGPVDFTNATGSTEVQSDSTGAFSVVGLAPGSYTVCTQDNFQPSPRGWGFAPSCWKNAFANDPSTTPDEITVTNGQLVPDIDFVVGELGAVTGTVVDDLHQPIAGVTVNAIPLDSNGGYPEAVVTDAAGHYLIPRVQPGRYAICFDPSSAGGNANGYTSECYGQQATVAASTPVAVTDNHAASGVDATLTRQGSVSGRVTYSTPTSYYFAVSIILYDSTNSYVTSVSPAENGNYTIPNVPPGTYTLEFQGSGAGYDDVYYHDVAPGGSPTTVTVSPGGAVLGIDQLLQLSPSS